MEWLAVCLARVRAPAPGVGREAPRMRGRPYAPAVRPGGAFGPCADRGDRMIPGRDRMIPGRDTMIPGRDTMIPET